MQADTPPPHAPGATPTQALDWDWQALLDDLPVGAFLARDGRFLFVNKALQHLFGYEAGGMAEQVSTLELAAPEDRETVLVHVRRRRHMVPELPYEVQCLRRDGSRFDARICGLRIQLDGQDADLVTVIDITDARQAMRHVLSQHDVLSRSANSLQMNRLILDRLPTPVLAVDQQAQIRYAN